MENNMVFVKSESEKTLVINIPDIPLHRTWSKRGQKFPFDRVQLEQIYYDPSVEFLFKSGMLVTDDKQFLKDVGLIDEEEKSEVYVLTKTMLNRIISLMPVSEVTEELKKMSNSQLNEVAEYAIENYKTLNMDRVDLLTKATGKNILKAIEVYKSSAED